MTTLGAISYADEKATRKDDGSVLQLSGHTNCIKPDNVTSGNKINKTVVSNKSKQLNEIGNDIHCSRYTILFFYLFL
jgi:hypothetical protein